MDTTSLPSGLLTAMFTDIVNSTRLKTLMPGQTDQRRNEAFRTAIKEPHDRLVLARVEDARGHLVEGTGDGFLFVFDDPQEAVLCALQIQKQLIENPIPTPIGVLQVRIGLHTGMARPTNGDFISSAIDAAARVTGNADAGQVFVSESVCAHLAGLRGVGSEVVGEYQLKGLGPAKLYVVFPSGQNPLARIEAAYRQHIIERFCKLTLYSVSSDAPLAVDLERVFVKLTAKRERAPGALDFSLSVFERLLGANTGPVGYVIANPPDRESHTRSVEPIALKLTGEPSLATIALIMDAGFKLQVTQTGEYWVSFGNDETAKTDCSMSELLSAHLSLAIIGAPGAGKTTLLKYLALTFARHQAKARLQLDEERLPVFVALRDFNRFLSNLDKQGKLGNPGPLLLPRFLEEQTQETAPHLKLPESFFAHALAQHRCVVLLDGLDEVADPIQRGRTAEVVASIATHYRGNRFVITSRKRGYESEARQRLAPLCTECNIRDFDDADRTEFARCWYAAVVTERAGDNETSRAEAVSRADDLLRAIAADARITALASNPLLLSILALVHQRGVGLPQGRAELYAECTEMLLGYWDQVRGGEAARELANYGGLNRQEKRALLEPIALWLHERGESGSVVVEKEMVAEVARQFRELFDDQVPQSQRRAELFLRVITERAGLLVERETGVFSFAHLSFQEYLAARALADRDDYIAYTLKHLHDPWWREVILLAIGHLGSFNSRQYRARTTALIQAMRQANSWLEEVLHRDLLLSCRALADVSQLGLDDKLRQAVFDDLFALWQTTPFNPQLQEIVSIFSYAGRSPDGSRIKSKLTGLLDDKNPVVRSRAASTLGGMGMAAAAPETVARLLELIRDPSFAVRLIAAFALGRMGAAAATPNTLAGLLELIRDPSLAVRHRAASALGQIGAAAATPDALAWLLELIRDPSDDVRRSAAFALGQMGAAGATPDTLARLLEFSRDTSDAVRDSAASALGQMGAAAATPSTLARLLALSRDPSDAVRRSAVEALGQMGAAAVTPDTLARLLELSRDPSDAVRRSAVSAFGEMGAAAATPDTLPRLTELLRDPSRFVRTSAAYALGLMGAAATTPDTLARLLEVSRDTNDDVRSSAAAALGQMGAAAAMPDTLARLLQLSRDQSEDVRRSAASALGRIGAASAAPDTLARMLELMRDPSEDVRVRVAQTLGQMGAAAATPATLARLLELSWDPNKAVRHNAASALGCMGPVAATPEILGRLLELIQGPDGNVRVHAAYAFGQMGTAAMDHSSVRTLTEFWSGVLKDVELCVFPDGHMRICDKAFNELQKLASHRAALGAAA